MGRFLLQSFLYSSFLWLFISCKTYHLAEAAPVQNRDKVVENLYFSSNEDYIYKCLIDIYKHHLSGILVIKKLNDTTHRVALTSDFGNKLIDFEISEQDFKVSYIIPDMDKKIVKNFLRNDFRQLLKRQYPVHQSFENKTHRIYNSETGKINYYLFVNKETQLLNKVVYTKNKKEKIDFSFDAKKHIFADSIDIAHKDFKINIKLFQITETE
ncbi:hypothetical protein [Chryseobacterium sp.]|uniref:hypothetical protein n=1 Tax=Chryseobacterium sp. TaxID=1871047 RepID=UPI0025BBC6C9|nr:hypothetical protein [Chryseobacterium sp.]